MYLTYKVTGMKNLEKRRPLQRVRVIKCVKVRALFAENKVRFARAEQLWCTHVKRNTAVHTAATTAKQQLMTLMTVH